MNGFTCLLMSSYILTVGQDNWRRRRRMRKEEVLVEEEEYVLRFTRVLHGG